jgi:hypothetical protein
MPFAKAVLERYFSPTTAPRNGGMKVAIEKAMARTPEQLCFWDAGAIPPGEPDPF